jgi:hypothetical protein
MAAINAPLATTTNNVFLIALNLLGSGDEEEHGSVKRSRISFAGPQWPEPPAAALGPSLLGLELTSPEPPPHPVPAPHPLPAPHPEPEPGPLLSGLLPALRSLPRVDPPSLATTAWGPET